MRSLRNADETYGSHGSVATRGIQLRHLHEGCRAEVDVPGALLFPGLEQELIDAEVGARRHVELHRQAALGLGVVGLGIGIQIRVELEDPVVHRDGQHVVRARRTRLGGAFGRVDDARSVDFQECPDGSSRTAGGDHLADKLGAREPALAVLMIKFVGLLRKIHALTALSDQCTAHRCACHQELRRAQRALLRRRSAVRGREVARVSPRRPPFTDKAG